jgi:hypothetical protein
VSYYALFEWWPSFAASGGFFMGTEFISFVAEKLDDKKQVIGRKDRKGRCAPAQRECAKREILCACYAHRSLANPSRRRYAPFAIFAAKKPFFRFR